MKKKLYLIIFILFFLFLLITCTSYANSIHQELSNNFFRLHILANSDSKEDQDLKLKIRDAILNYMNYISFDTLNKDDALKLAQAHINDFQKIAKETIKNNGYSYDVKIELGNFYFPTKKYYNLSLPAGNYDSLKIIIGNGNGQNWWCSLFPPLCFIDISSGVIESEEKNLLKENLSNEEFTLITNSNDNETVKFKFKIVELFS